MKLYLVNQTSSDGYTCDTRLVGIYRTREAAEAVKKNYRWDDDYDYRYVREIDTDTPGDEIYKEY